MGGLAQLCEMQRSHIFAAILMMGGAMSMASRPSLAGEIDPELARALAHRGRQAEVEVIVRLQGRALPQDRWSTSRINRSTRVYQALRERYERVIPEFASRLRELGARKVRDLWIIHGMALSLPADAVLALAATPGVASVTLDSYVQGGHSQRMPAGRQRPVATVDDVAPKAQTRVLASTGQPPGPVAWNLAAIHAPVLWEQNHQGQGVVVASMDTGVDLDHPDLRRSWRGGANSWFDPHQEEPRPYDALGHGTQALSIVLGVAPQALWIAVRLYDHAGRARMSDIHAAFQWLLDPDGNPQTLDAPDIVNASWTLTGRGAGQCIHEFHDDIQALRDAGIAVVFAAGNDGPAVGTSSSPANNPGALSVGALSKQLKMARQTSRGPSACDGGLFPRVWAPGVDIRAADLSHGGVRSYAVVSGSSMAAPHATGVLALLMSADPAATLAELETTLVTATQPINHDAQEAHAGMLDAAAALQALRELRQGQPRASPTAEPARAAR